MADGFDVVGIQLHVSVAAGPGRWRGDAISDSDGVYIWTDYFYWDGSKPVAYGTNFYDGYSYGGMFMPTYCTYWTDIVNGTVGWYGAISCDG